jgi:hypothetical protein
MASPPTHHLMGELHKNYQTPPKVYNFEDGNCKFVEMLETP